jgi:8-oxo-dGTP pyrophosphatase MutT (NUDIX family)
MIQIEAAPIPSQFDRYGDDVDEDLKKELASPTLPEYPTRKDRWHFPKSEWDDRVCDGVLTVPDEVWVTSNHSRRREAAVKGVLFDAALVDDDHPIDPARTAAWRAQGLLVTDRGLPVHPLAKLGLTTHLGDDPQAGWIGMATGIGRERYWGELISGNLGIKRRAPSGLIEYAVVGADRAGKVKISFPGGYAERGEAAVAACIREGGEETGIVEACEAAGIPWSVIEQLPMKFWEIRPSIGGPCTLNAWLAEKFLMIDATSVPEMAEVELRPRDPNEIKSVGWIAVHQILRSENVLGAHRRALLADMMGDGDEAA